MPRYAGRTGDKNEFDGEIDSFNRSMGMVLGGLKEIGKNDKDAKEFLWKMAKEGRKLGDEGNRNVGGLSYLFSGFGPRKSAEEAAPAAEEATVDEIPPMAPSKTQGMADLKRYDEQTYDPKLLDFIAKDMAQESTQEIPPMPPREMGDLRAIEGGRYGAIERMEPGVDYERDSISGGKMKARFVPGQEGDENYRVDLPMLDASGEKKRPLPAPVSTVSENEIPPMMPVQKKQEEDGSFVGSMGRIADDVAAERGIKAATARLNALRQYIKQVGVSNLDDAKAQKILEEIRDLQRPWQESREGQKALFTRETGWEDPKNKAMADLYEEKARKSKEGKGEDDLAAKRFKLQDMNSELNLNEKVKGVVKPFAEAEYGLKLVRNSSLEADRLEKLNRPPNPALDLAVIFGTMKLLDPGSTVREAEAASVQNMTNIPGWMWNMFERAKSGQMLNSTQRAQLRQLAEANAINFYESNHEVLDNYRGMVARSGYKTSVPKFELLESLGPQKEKSRTIEEAAVEVMRDKNATSEERRRAREILNSKR